ncbi:hypothetical protein BS17DRAFT_351873 [Gyrodon lividus]|nr:hypothetical protein BS17DRAFT_351873 [Gyrodon lividus]
MTEGNGAIIVRQGERELSIGTVDVKKCQRKMTYMSRDSQDRNMKVQDGNAKVWDGKYGVWNVR